MPSDPEEFSILVRHSEVMKVVVGSGPLLLLSAFIRLGGTHKALRAVIAAWSVEKLSDRARFVCLFVGVFFLCFFLQR